ncbi:MAG: ABC transporter permease subunit [Thermoflexales bacterium]
MRTTQLGLMFVYAAIAMPFCVWNMRLAFQSVPRELAEAAFIDGASFSIVFFRVTLPLALSAIGLAALVAFLSAYSEFALGWMFVDRADNVTLAMGLGNAIRLAGNGWNLMAAYALMMSVPVDVVFVLLQHYLVNGLLAGKVEP